MVTSAALLKAGASLVSKLEARAADLCAASQWDLLVPVCKELEALKPAPLVYGQSAQAYLRKEKPERLRAVSETHLVCCIHGLSNKAACNLQALLSPFQQSIDVEFVAIHVKTTDIHSLLC